MKRSAFFCALLAGIVSTNAVAQDVLPRDNGLVSYHTQPRWRESEEHPLRVAAYIVHPIGWVLREAIFRPISYFAGSTETTRSVLGYREPFDYREPLCFSGTEDVPDCKTISPFGNRMNMSGEDGDAENNDMNTVEEQKVVFPDVNFDFDKSTLNSLGRSRVRQVAQMLSSMPTVNVVVEGHTDYKGSDQYNQQLGARRAQTVMHELQELGVDRARMSEMSYGESRPLFTEDTDWARSANRRVQFSVQGAVPAEPAAAGNDMPSAAK